MKGFTLVETLVAITIIVIAVLGPFQMVQQGLLASYAARDQLIATALAEEGIEYVRAVRDGNYLYNLANPSTPRSWLFGIDGTGGSPNCTTANGCVVDPTGTTNVLVCGATCPVMTVSSGSLYTQQTGSSFTATRFTRKIKLTSISANETQLTGTVTFTTAHTPFTVTVTDNLYNWL